MHEKAEQIRARIVCTPAESARRACGSACADGMEYIFFAFSVGYAWAYIVGRELTDLRSKRGRRRRDRVRLAAAV